jgi:hypothetical protein
MCERRLFHNLIHSRGEDKSQVLRVGQTQLVKRGAGKGEDTSGKPLGSKNSFGMTDCAFDFASSLGGDGLAVYSVKASPLESGVLGVCTPL